jgi:hypothetical protein
MIIEDNIKLKFSMYDKYSQLDYSKIYDLNIDTDIQTGKLICDLKIINRAPIFNNHNVKKKVFDILKELSSTYMLQHIDNKLKSSFRWNFYETLSLQLPSILEHENKRFKKLEAIEKL